MKRPILAVVVTLAATAAVPATASAASIALTAPGGTPTITYTGAPGEVNALEMHGTAGGGLDLRMPFNEFSAPLTDGASCSGLKPTLCGFADKAFPVSISLGDRSDVANTNSFPQSLTMDAGPGDDDVLAGGLDATADGGGGSDTVILAANNLATGDGGPGRDRIYGGLGAAAAILSGGNGADLLVPDGFMLSQAEGGSGADRLVSLAGDRVTLIGNSGSDVLAAPGGRRPALDGGSGRDTIFSHAGGATVDAGAGNDVIDVRGPSDDPADTVTCGAGFDVAWVNGGDSVADDCETVIRRGTPPAQFRVTAAIEAANALRAHRPDPSAL
jgi:Ca2+-binding RTX toxin-like protein